ncbi:hypothetical protein AC579_2203 [Pseudocercospora musae]|uniref:Uncharacterized protein n=1 Tax=Pseudocercospora musae TaxID=113226 RepID=A0A139IKP8_9PEZI|nr:hypothetical protein AC579_2203 [Pseudocercospora musae]
MKAGDFTPVITWQLSKVAKFEVWRETPHDANIREIAMGPDTRASSNFNWELQSAPRSDLTAGELLKAGAGQSRYRLDLTTNQHDRVSGMATLNATSSHKLLGHANQLLRRPNENP